MISKKDLLKEMKISYGQLYRWKREGLIPDDWFIKQSVSTGQETYFKKDLIIPRIKTILELKDNYQLEDLKVFLSPDLKNKEFTLRNLILVDQIDPLVLKTFAKNNDKFSIYEAVIIYIFSTNKEILDYSLYCDYDYSTIKSIKTKLFIIKEEDVNKILICEGNVIFDKKIEILKEYDFEEVASIIAKQI